jgi:hypothetical protein
MAGRVTVVAALGTTQSYGSLVTRRWRETDSNFQFLARVSFVKPRCRSRETYPRSKTKPVPRSQAHAAEIPGVSTEVEYPIYLFSCRAPNSENLPLALSLILELFQF